MVLLHAFLRIECILIDLLSIHMFFLVLSILKVKLFVFLLFICQISLYILDSISSSNITYCQISSCLWLANLSSWCFSFWWSISFSFWWSPINHILLLWWMVFVFCIGNVCLTQICEGISIYSLPKPLF